jgi:hypothetical protein
LKPIKKILKWFDTAPPIKTEAVRTLEREGKLRLLVDAVESERRGEKSTNGITVKKV